MFALGILTMLSLVIQQTLTTTNQTDRYLSAVRRATERGEALSYEVFDLVDASRKLFQKDTLGAGYLASLDLARFPLLPNARLPLIDEENDVAPDVPGLPHTGNILLFIQETDPLECMADPATSSTVLIDLYRFVCIYPHETDRRIVTENTRARDLILWLSEGFPSYAQIMAIDDPVARRNVVADLHANVGYEVLWDPNADVASAFYATDPLGTIAGQPIETYRIPEDPDRSVPGRLVHADTQLARSDASRRSYRPVLTADDPAVWAPDGFEVKVTGASGSRKVWIRIVVESLSATGRVAVQPNTLVVSARDM
jgi:hypothetical protein